MRLLLSLSLGLVTVWAIGPLLVPVLSDVSLVLFVFTTGLVTGLAGKRGHQA